MAGAVGRHRERNRLKAHRIARRPPGSSARRTGEGSENQEPKDPDPSSDCHQSQMVNPREATYAGGALGVLDDSLLATELTWGEHLVKFVNPNVEDDVPGDYRRLLSVRELAPETFSDDDMEEICEQFRDQ